MQERHICVDVVSTRQWSGGVPSEDLVTEFLGDPLALGALGVPELEARARAAGLLPEHQHDQAVRPPLCLGRVTIQVPRQKPLRANLVRECTT
jgi:hypothetical protein